MLMVESQSLDVYRNLATEEYLMEHSAEPVLFLWRSSCAVVVGKNQNPWRECRLDLMRAEGVPLARRISGGGTVYHDEGNLNYCVVVDRTQYREEQAFELVFQTLETFGIRAERTGKSNLSVDGLKFSGNAFCFRKGRALHHGTLLLQADLGRLGRYLEPMLGGIETRAVVSVPAQVANLGLDIGLVAAGLRDRFAELYGNKNSFQSLEIGSDMAELASLEEKHRSGEWKYGTTPKFTVERDGMLLEVEKGIVVRGAGKGADPLLKRPFSDTLFSLV